MINETLKVSAGEVRDDQHYDTTSDTDQNAKRHEKYTKLMRLNEEESEEWVNTNMNRNTLAGVTELLDFLEWFNIQNKRVPILCKDCRECILKPTAPILANENKNKETIVEPLNKRWFNIADLAQVNL